MARLSEEERNFWHALSMLVPGAVRKERADAWKAGWDAARNERPADLDGAGKLPTPTLESASAADFAARWNAMTPDDREMFFQAIRESDLEWLKWHKAKAANDTGEHDHEFEDCCVICGKTWHEVNG